MGYGGGGMPPRLSLPSAFLDRKGETFRFYISAEKPPARECGGEISAVRLVRFCRACYHSGEDCRWRLVTLCEGGDAMNYVTYSDLIQIGLLIVAIVALCKTGDK